MLMNFSSLIHSIRNTHETLYLEAVKAVNTSLTLRNWLIGFYIVEYEQNGEDRAAYGKKLIEKLAQQLEIKGLGLRNLNLFRQFYLIYPQIMQALSANSRSQPIVQTLSAKFNQLQIRQTLPDELPVLPGKKAILGTVTQELTADPVYYFKLISRIPFSHFTELIKIKDPLKRRYYEMLTMKQTLSVRELKRQINTLGFERLGLSTNKTKALAQIEKSIKPRKAGDAVKDLYFFEFLQLPHKEVVEESDIEQALLDHFQDFIMELGIGFCIEARQKKILIGDEYFFIDLVLYHRILKCHVLVELKADAFNHSYLSQLNTYVNYYKEEIKERSDNPPVGILLVADKNKPLVQYALGAVTNKLFVSKYKLQLPDKKALEKFVKDELKKL